jgi:hypothetical protein
MSSGGSAVSYTFRIVLAHDVAVERQRRDECEADGLGIDDLGSASFSQFSQRRLATHRQSSRERRVKRGNKRITRIIVPCARACRQLSSPSSPNVSSREKSFLPVRIWAWISRPTMSSHPSSATVETQRAKRGYASRLGPAKAERRRSMGVEAVVEARVGHLRHFSRSRLYKWR